MQPPEAAPMRQAAVFVDVGEEASCVPCGCVGKGERYQSDAARVDLVFADARPFAWATA
ncbi:hypothetical protein BJ6T_69610 [Bradyrhizobium japonicum USDA 6]|nr:hypothetical protein BJ6T_69610 [Bradyrhizobium japonicum USDA 6]